MTCPLSTPGSAGLDRKTLQLAICMEQLLPANLPPLAFRKLLQTGSPKKRAVHGPVGSLPSNHGIETTTFFGCGSYLGGIQSETLGFLRAVDLGMIGLQVRVSVFVGVL